MEKARTAFKISMLKIYGIKNCDTMKKAFTLLDELGLAYTFHDYKKTGIAEATLQAWVDQLGVDSLVNRKGTTWRKLSTEEQAQAGTAAGAIALMQANPSLIKRPVLDSGHGLICGLDLEAYRQLKT